MNRLTEFAAPLLLIAAMLAVWQMACVWLAIPSYLLPSPLLVALAAAEHTPELAAAAGRTLAMALMALGLVSVLATGLAILLAVSRLAERAIKPVAIGLQVTPVIAIAPLAMIWAGLDHPDRAIIGLAAIVAFFPVFSGALTGLKSADPDLERLFDLYGAGRWRRLMKLRLPAAVPFMLEGHKVAAGQALVGAVVAEFVARTGSSRGLAWVILEAGQRLETPKLFAALFVLAAMGAGLFVILQVLERSALRWWRGR